MAETLVNGAVPATRCCNACGHEWRPASAFYAGHCPNCHAATGFECDGCGRKGLAQSEMGKFHGGNCGYCRRCLVKVEGPAVRLGRGTNRTPPKKKRKKR